MRKCCGCLALNKKKGECNTGTAWFSNVNVLMYAEAIFTLKLSLKEANLKVYGHYQGLLGGPLDRVKTYPCRIVRKLENMWDKGKAPVCPSNKRDGFECIDLFSVPLWIPARAERTAEDAQRFKEFE